MSRIEEFFEKSVNAGIIPQIPMNYDAVSYKIYTGYLENKIDELTAENAELRARLDKAVEVENKINNGELVGAIWFKSWLNGIVCCGRVVGYGDGGFVIESGNDLISAKKIYTSREQAENGENKNGDDLPF